MRSFYLADGHMRVGITYQLRDAWVVLWNDLLHGQVPLREQAKENPTKKLH